MEKIKYTQPIRSKNERIGSITGIMDMNKQYLLVGDKIKLGNYIGRLLWNRYCNEYGIAFGLWYGDKNEFDIDSYGKFIKIPNDNGMRMEITKL